MNKKDSGPSLIKAGIIRSIAASAFCLLFSIVYNHFGHGVHSPFLSWLFLFPLLFGTALYLVFYLTGVPHRPSPAAFSVYRTGVSTLTVGSALTGIMEIAGTSSPYIKIYWILGFASIAAAILLQVTYTHKRIMPSHTKVTPSRSQ